MQHAHYVLVKAPLQVCIYYEILNVGVVERYKARGAAECLISLETTPAFNIYRSIRA